MGERHASLEVFAARLKLEREARGWTYRDLAGHVGTSFGHLCYLERGTRDPGLSMACRIADAFGLPLSEFLVPVRCGQCLDRPPAGFTCNSCGAVSDA